MPKPLLAISSAAMAAALSFAPSHAKAEAVDRYFFAAPYSCNGPLFSAEWQISGDSAGVLTIQSFVRRADLTSARFKGSQWQVDASALAAPLNLTNRNNRAEWRISDLLGAEPSIVPVDSKGEPRAKCSPVFEVVASAEQRFQDVFTFLDTAEPTPQDAQRIESQVQGLPPTNLLPELQRTAASADIKSKSSDFWTRYSDTSQKRAADIADADIMAGLDAALVNATGRQKRWHSELLTKAIAIRVTALADAGQDPATNAATPEQFCERLANFTGTSRWNDNLRTMTGVPVESWNEAFAQTYLQAAAACEKSDYFTKTVTQRWPEILKLQEGRAELLAHAERIGNIELTLESAAAENWLELGRATIAHYREAGLGSEEVKAVLEPVLTERRNQAIAPLAAEMAQAGSDLALGEMPMHCTKARRALPVARYETASIFPAIEAECNSILASSYLDSAVEIIEQRKTELLALEDTMDALVANDYFSVASSMQAVGRASGEFDTANRQILAAVDKADAELDGKRQAVLDVAQAEVSAVLDIADLDEAYAAQEKACGSVSRSYDRRNAPLATACQRNLRELTARRDKVVCDQIWEGFEGPKDFRKGSIGIPGSATPMQIEVMVCSPDFRNLGLEVVDNSGIFRSEYLLEREEVFGGTNVKFSAVLEKPSSGSSEWTLSEPTINGAALSGPEYKTSVDYMGCAIRLEYCFRQN